MNDDRVLWRAGGVECVMVTCCAGAELQLRRVAGQASGEIVLRELYPMKSDLYERSRTLQAEYERPIPSD